MDHPPHWGQVLIDSFKNVTDQIKKKERNTESPCSNTIKRGSNFRGQNAFAPKAKGMQGKKNEKMKRNKIKIKKKQRK